MPGISVPGVSIQRITPESFQAWKQQKDEAKEQAAIRAEAQRQAEIADGRAAMTGRELYERHPELFEDY